MPPVDLEQLKTALKQPNRKLPAASRLTRAPRTGQRSAVADEIEQGIKAMLTGQSFDPERLAKLRDLYHREQTQRAKQQPAMPPGPAPAHITKAEFLRALEERRKAISLLDGIREPFVPVQVTLDQPFLIWQLPNPQSEIFLDQVYAPFGSLIKINAYTTSGSDNTQFIFYFWWKNDADTFALINVSTSLVLNGKCAAAAAPAVLFGNNAYLDMSASLNLLQWWTQPPTTPAYQSTQFHSITSLHASTGASFDFGSPDEKLQVFFFFPIDLSYSMLAVPPQSGLLIEVSVQMDYSFDGGELDLSEFVQADFSSGDGFIMCPSVQLEILTAAQSVASK